MEIHDCILHSIHGEKDSVLSDVLRATGEKAKLEHIFSLLTLFLGTESKKLINYPINLVIIAEKIQV